MAVLWHFHPAGGIPGLLDDHGVVGAAGGVVVENDRVGEAGGDDFLAAESIVLGLRGWLLAVEEEEDSEDQDEDGCPEPYAPELAVAGGRGRGTGYVGGAVGVAGARQVSGGARRVTGGCGEAGGRCGMIGGGCGMVSRDCSIVAGSRLDRFGLAGGGDRRVTGGNWRMLGVFGGKVPPVIIPKELSEGIKGVCIGEAVVLHFAPDALEGDMAKGYAGLVADQFAQLEEVLIGPGVTVAPPGLVFEHFLNQPDQAFIGLHRYKE